MYQYSNFYRDLRAAKLPSDVEQSLRQFMTTIARTSERLNCEFVIYQDNLCIVLTLGAPVVLLKFGTLLLNYMAELRKEYTVSAVSIAMGCICMYVCLYGGEGKEVNGFSLTLNQSSKFV